MLRNYHDKPLHVTRSGCWFFDPNTSTLTDGSWPFLSTFFSSVFGPSFYGRLIFFGILFLGVFTQPVTKCRSHPASTITSGSFASGDPHVLGGQQIKFAYQVLSVSVAVCQVDWRRYGPRPMDPFIRRRLADLWPAAIRLIWKCVVQPIFIGRKTSIISLLNADSFTIIKLVTPHLIIKMILMKSTYVRWYNISN